MTTHLVSTISPRLAVSLFVAGLFLVSLAVGALVDLVAWLRRREPQQQPEPFVSVVRSRSVRLPWGSVSVSWSRGRSEPQQPEPYAYRSIALASEERAARLAGAPVSSFPTFSERCSWDSSKPRASYSAPPRVSIR